MSMQDPYDAEGREDAEAVRVQRTRVAAQLEVDDLRWLMSSKRGRRIMWRRLADAQVFHTVFDTNALQMAFKEGQRNQGLRTLTQCMQLCAENYALMVQENVNG